MLNQDSFLIQVELIDVRHPCASQTDQLVTSENVMKRCHGWSTSMLGPSMPPT